MEEQQPDAGAPDPSQKTPQKTEAKKHEPLFDHRLEKTLRLPVPSSKRCRLRFPTDQEWVEAHRRVKLVRQNLGRGKSRTETYGVEEGHQQLFNEIRQDDAEPFDEVEASRIIETLTMAEAEPAKPNGSGCTIPLLVVGDVETLHSMRYPSLKNQRRYDREATTVTTLGGGNVEIRGNLEVTGQLYDDLLIEARGYAEGARVPLAHKQAVISELMASLAELEVAVEDPH